MRCKPFYEGLHLAFCRFRTFVLDWSGSYADLQPYALILYWLMISAVLGCAITPLIYDRKGRNPWQGAVTGSGRRHYFGADIRATASWHCSAAVLPDLATWISMLGGLVGLVALWLANPSP